MTEWNLNQAVPTTSPTAPSTTKEWDVGQSHTAPASTTQGSSQQWEVTAQQWNAGHPASLAAAKGAAQAEESKQEPQWNMAVSTPQAETGQWNMVQQQQQQQQQQQKQLQTAVAISTTPELQLAVSAEQWGTDEKPPPQIAPEPMSQKQQESVPEPAAVRSAEFQQSPQPSLSAARTTSVQVSMATPMAKPLVPPPTTKAQPSVQQVTTAVAQQSSNAVIPQPAPGLSTSAQATPQTSVKVTSQVTMQSKVTHEGVTETSQAKTVMRDTHQPQTAPKPAPQQPVAYTHAAPAPAVKPKPQGDNQDVVKSEGGDDFPLEEKQKGVFWLGPDLEGWVDKTKALKEEFRRQSDANEMYFVKNQRQLDLKSLNISEDPSKFVYNVLDLRGIDVVNLVRCILNEHHHSETGPFFFQFGDDKKFKLELLPTATQPGNGLIKSVGRRKYYAYPDICAMLKGSGVTSKGLGIMLQKLNTSGLKPALHNQISPMNELHFMLLYEIARRLVRGPHGFSLSTEPEYDQLPIGVAVARMITMFCRGNYCLNYEAVFGVQDKFNPFIDTNVVLRRQKIYALNKLFYDAEIRPQARDNPHISKFLKYHNGYIIKTTKGFMEELDMAFRGF